MGVRESRLRAEYDAMKKFRSNVISWEAIGGGHSLPDKYYFTYNLTSLIGFDDKGKPRYHKGFVVEINFPLDYPRGKPEVRLRQRPWPFHPNIWSNDGRFCLEGNQHWIAGIGVSLDSICFMIGEIISFQEVNLSSPANNDAVLTKWIHQNLRFITKTKVANPIDPSQIRLPDIEDAISWGEKTSAPPKIRFG